MAVSLLQVVADDLVGLTALRREPTAHALMAFRPQPLRQPLVRRLADERVGEPKRIPAGHLRGVRLDQLPADEREQGGGGAASLTLGKQLDDCRSVEAAPLDRRALEHQTLARFEGVDTGRKHRANARRQRGGVAVLLLHGDELLEEEWVPFRSLDDSRERRLSKLLGPVVVRRARMRRLSAAARGRGAGESAALPTPVGVRAAPGAPSRAAGSGSHSRTPPRTRAGRARLVRPSADPRTRRSAAASGRGPRRAAARPTTSPPVAPPPRRARSPPAPGS